jgi:hypothetical protein
MATTTLQRLLKYPHAAVFDKDPAPATAFHLRHTDGASWMVSERVLSVFAGELELSFDLSLYTIDSLATALGANGFDVEFLSPQYRYLSAMALVEGSGSQDVSNGDRLTVYTSLLWVLLSAYSAELFEASEQIVQALRQMVITTAEGEWLDLWGMLYAEPRRQGESDASYAARIPQEAFRIRVNARAIEQAILDATGFDVRIEEPWTEIFTLDDSLLSGDHKLYDGTNVGYHLIRPVTRQTVDWPAVLAVINRNRAAGVLVLQSRTFRTSFVDGTGAVVDSKLTHNRRVEVLNEDIARLDFMNVEDVSVPNHPARRIPTRRYLSRVVVDFSGFTVHFQAGRTYRTYYSDVTYTGQYWLGNATWESADATWGVTAVVSSHHTRS